MIVMLVVTEGPHAGREFLFKERDTFLVGRSRDAHFQLSYDDPYFSRRHFLLEVHPPRARVMDLNSRNGIRVNGHRVRAADLHHGDMLSAGHTVFRVVAPQPKITEEPPTLGAESAQNPNQTAALMAATIECTAGPRIPGYRLTAELGRGAMGTVYRAERAHDGMPVAVKIIAPAAGVSRRKLEKFLREARIVANLDHPNIVQYLANGEVDGLLYLAMGLVDGPDGKRLVKERGPLPVPLAVRLMLQALDGLAHAHAKGFVHRDVKPSNLLVENPEVAPVVKVADFGLARVYEACSLSGLTMQGEVGGTPAFMAPEQVTHYRDAKPPADQYAAAASLYYLLTGCYILDFSADTGDQLVQLVTEKPIPIRDRRQDVPLGLAAAIHQAMSREPEERFPTVTAFREAIAAWAQ